MNEEKLPRKILEWCPSGRRRKRRRIRKGTPRNLWIQEIIMKNEKIRMRDKAINNKEWK